MSDIFSHLIKRIQAAADSVVGEMSNRELVAFYIFSPFILGIILGFMRAQYGATFPIGVSLIIWPAGLFMTWIAFELGIFLIISFFQRAEKWPLILLFFLGGTLGKIVTLPVRSVLTTGLVGLLGSERPSYDYLEENIFHIDSLILFFDIFVFPLALWTGVNYLFIFVLGVPRYGREARVWSEKSSAGAAQDRVNVGLQSGQFSGGEIPALVKEIPGFTHEDIICLVSEGNYLRVHTPSRNWLVRSTLSQALDQFCDVDGAQVHRSYWIYRPAVVDVKRNGRSYELHMRGGLIVPVSRAHMGLARKLKKTIPV